MRDPIIHEINLNDQLKLERPAAMNGCDIIQSDTYKRIQAANKHRNCLVSSIVTFFKYIANYRQMF